ncbi:MAG: GatB/YqeY domain-containing protein [Balneolaceae bacterium]
MGRVMGVLMGELKGKAEGGLVSRVVKEQLTG